MGRMAWKRHFRVWLGSNVMSVQVNTLPLASLLLLPSPPRAANCSCVRARNASYLAQRLLAARSVQGDGALELRSPRVAGMAEGSVRAWMASVSASCGVCISGASGRQEEPQDVGEEPQEAP
eukprot:TRINITY_DN15546_c0_g1_i7.p3 TRINITY_DN15546_c0_g1~~TRINITY_DN15546_c0_g1_i7.p3  ORF type:complete len:122 (-),score=2.21 TRINITY_DN15546_c0_g1_i7:178-543(-)